MLADARDQNKNIILDGTLKDPDKAETLVRDFKRSGYEVEVRAMAVSKETSELGVYERLRERHEGRARCCALGPRRGFATTPMTACRVPSTGSKRRKTRRCERTGSGSYARAPDAAGQPDCLYDSQAPSNVEKTARESIEAERDRIASYEEEKIRHDKWMAICEQIKTRDPYLKEPETGVPSNSLIVSGKQKTI